MITTKDETEWIYEEVHSLPEIFQESEVLPFILKSGILEIYNNGVTKHVNLEDIKNIEVMYVICQEPIGFVPWRL